MSATQGLAIKRDESTRSSRMEDIWPWFRDGGLVRLSECSSRFASTAEAARAW
jgi:hypothetical protein